MNNVKENEDTRDYVSQQLDFLPLSKTFKLIWKEWTQEQNGDSIGIRGRIFHLFIWSLSVMDVISDFLLVNEYVTTQVVTRTARKSLLKQWGDYSSTINKTYTEFGGCLTFQKRMCYLKSTSFQNVLVYSCEEHNYWYAVMTLTFIYLPLLNVISALFGKFKAGVLVFFWSVWSFIFVWRLSKRIGCCDGDVEDYLLQWSMFSVMIFMFGLSSAQLFYYAFKICKGEKYSGLTLKYFVTIFLSSIIFCFLPPISPFILLLIEFVAVIKPNSKFIKSQVKIANRGESIFEATPQLILQLFIILFSGSASSSQVFSIVTSTASLCLPNIEDYLEARSKEFGIQQVMKNLFPFLTITLYKIFTFSIICMFFKYDNFPYSLFFPLGYFLLLLMFLGIVLKHFKLTEEDGWFAQIHFEELLLSWMTLTHLGNSRTDAIIRTTSSLFVIVYNTGVLATVMVICNLNPEIFFFFGVTSLIPGHIRSLSGTFPT